MLSTDEMEYTFIHRTDNLQLTAATSFKIVRNFFTILSPNILIWITHIHILMRGKCYRLGQLREHDAKIKITHAEHYRESDNLF